MTSKASLVQRHRAQMAELGWARLEVRLGREFIKQAREFARQKQMPFRHFVEQAIIAYATTLNASSGNAADKNR
jgi:hypothetical protein